MNKMRFLRYWLNLCLLSHRHEDAQEKLSRLAEEAEKMGLNINTVLSISFKVDVPTGKVGGSLLFERQRCKLPRGVWGHAPPENFEI